MAKEKIEMGCTCWNCMAKGHVKKNSSVTLAMKPIPVKTLFLNLQKVKENNKKEVATVSDKQ